MAKSLWQAKHLMKVYNGMLDGEWISRDSCDILLLANSTDYLTLKQVDLPWI